MKTDEAIRRLKADKEYLLDNKVCDGEEIDVAINIMEQKQNMNSCRTCRYSGSPSAVGLYCLIHGCYFSYGSLCRDWERDEY